MLRFRLLVHDSDILKRRIPARQSPLVEEHVEESLFEMRFGYRRTRQPGFALTVDQQRVEKTAARIGVDLDEMRALLVQVEIVAEEHAEGGRPRIIRVVIPAQAGIQRAYRRCISSTTPPCGGIFD